MEKTFHLGMIGPKPSPTPEQVAVQLKGRHLWLSAQVIADTIGPERQAYMVYYPQRGSLLLAPMSDEVFKQMHKCSLVMLKDRSPQGDKSISLQEVLIDHDEIDPCDRPLSYLATPGVALLQVQLGSFSSPSDDAS